MLTYYVESFNPNEHVFDIKLQIPEPDVSGQRICLPNWIPGSYLFRDYARHIIKLQVFVGKKHLSPLAIHKINSNTWQCEPTSQPITIKYSVYAWDLSVEGAHLDQTKGFFNGCALFFAVEGKEAEPLRIHISPPNCEAAYKWQLATTLTRKKTNLWDFGWYYADSYDDLIDHPVLMGKLEIVEFNAENIPHYIVICGKQDGDLHRLSKDVKKICEQNIQLFQETPPFDRYMFLVTVLKGDEGGGLEHRYSSALLVERDYFPITGDASINNDYLYLLSLFSHEYFHAWNVKRLKPENFTPYDLNVKNYTSQLWAFEGMTSYFGDLALIRSKVISKKDYLKLLSQDVTKLLRTPGRMVQTVAESSFDVWIKYNQPNENSLNSGVNYYVKGKLIALIIDLSLRIQSNNIHSMDEIMRILWSRYGKQEKGVPEGGIDEVIQEIGGQSIISLVQDALYSTKELPIERVLTQCGFVLDLQSILSVKDKELKNKGLDVQAHQKSPFKQGVFGCTTFYYRGQVYVSYVSRDSAASKAGISANDEIIAINGIRVDDYSLDKITKRLKVGESIRVHVFRQDELLKLKLILTEPPLDLAKISFNENPSEQQKELITSWLLN